MDNFEQAITEFAAEFGWPVVIKYDGLLGGKGVEVVNNTKEAVEFINHLTRIIHTTE